MALRPNFFIVGAPKCGTTALYHYLREHPQVFLPVLKEPHFFAYDLYGPKATVTKLEDYLALFADCPTQCRAVGEASVLYLFSKTAMANIKEFDPEARIIVMLRNPVDVAYALHGQLLVSLRETEKDFIRAWGLQEQRRAGQAIPKTCDSPKLLQYRQVVSFGSQLQACFQIFPRQQVHIILLEDLAQDPSRIYREVLDFLGLDDDGREDFPRINEHAVNRSDIMAGVLRRTPAWALVLKRVLHKITGKESLGLAEWLLRVNERKMERARLPEQFRAQMAAELAGEVDLLSHLLERGLSHWRH